MKKTILMAVLVGGLALYSCGGKDAKKTSDNAIDAVKKTVENASDDVASKVKEQKDKVVDMAKEKQAQLVEEVNKVVSATEKLATDWVGKVESMGAIVSKKYSKQIADVKNHLTELKEQKDAYQKASEDKKTEALNKMQEISNTIKQKITEYSNLLK